MKDNVRAIFTAAAIAHATGKKVSSVYDYSVSRYRAVDAEVTSSRVTAYDYEGRHHFDGAIPSLYHYGERCHVDLKSNGGGRYSGYNYGTSSHFEVTVSSSGSADLYDYGVRKYFSYLR